MKDTNWSKSNATKNAPTTSHRSFGGAGASPRLIALTMIRKTTTTAATTKAFHMGGSPGSVSDHGAVLHSTTQVWVVCEMRRLRSESGPCDQGASETGDSDSGCVEPGLDRDWHLSTVEVSKTGGHKSPLIAYCQANPLHSRPRQFHEQPRSLEGLKLSFRKNCEPNPIRRNPYCE